MWNYKIGIFPPNVSSMHSPEFGAFCYDNNEIRGKALSIYTKVKQWKDKEDVENGFMEEADVNVVS
jgi:hypothetical protein